MGGEATALARLGLAAGLCGCAAPAVDSLSRASQAASVCSARAVGASVGIGRTGDTSLGASLPLRGVEEREGVDSCWRGGDGESSLLSPFSSGLPRSSRRTVTTLLSTFSTALSSSASARAKFFCSQEAIAARQELRSRRSAHAKTRNPMPCVHCA